MAFTLHSGVSKRRLHASGAADGSVATSSPGIIRGVPGAPPPVLPPMPPPSPPASSKSRRRGRNGGVAGGGNSALAPPRGAADDQTSERGGGGSSSGAGGDEWGVASSEGGSCGGAVGPAAGPVPSPDRRTGSIDRPSKEQLWSYLFHNVNRAVDELCVDVML